MKKSPSRFALGLHYDLHAGKGDTDLGTRCGLSELAPALKRMGPDFVQTDCKGKPGYTSWFSRTPRLDDRLLPIPALVVEEQGRRAGKGKST